jgi:hypothetical protein
MTVLEQYQCQYWDMYKDAFGIRPRGTDTSSWTEQDFEKEFEYLADAIRREDPSRGRGAPQGGGLVASGTRTCRIQPSIDEK